jgi:outer membrane murein-binding lipoprotein Lpp
MTRSTLFDRLNQELEAFGKKAQAALDEGKLQIEVLRLRRRRDNAARDLGLLVHRRERGGGVEAARVDALMLRIDDLQADIARLEQQLEESRGRSGSVEEKVGTPGAM